MIPILTNIGFGAAGHLRRLVPDRGVLLDPRPRPRGAAGRQPQRLSGDPGGDGLPGDADDADQSGHRPAVQGGRPAGGAQDEPRSLPKCRAPGADALPSRSALRSEGVWRAAWRRFRGDRVGMVSLLIVAAFLVLIALSATGAGGQRLAGRGRRAQRAAHLRSARGRPKTSARSRCPRARTSTSPTSTRWRRATRNGPSAPRRSRPPRRRASRHAAARRRPAGPRRAGQGVKGTEMSVFVGVLAAVLATLIGTLLGAAAGFFGGKVGDFLEWVYNVFTVDPRHPADLRLRGGVRPRHRHGGADPRPHRLDRRLPPGARRVHQAPRRASTCARPRRSAPAPARACSATSCPTSAT